MRKWRLNRMFSALIAVWFGVSNVVLAAPCAMHHGRPGMGDVAMGEMATRDMATEHSGADVRRCEVESHAPAASQSDTTGHECSASACSCLGHCCSTAAIGLPHAPVLLGLPAQGQSTFVARCDALLRPERVDLQLSPATGPPLTRMPLLA